MSKTFKIVGDDISDGFHTFDELYEHRCMLFIVLCLQNKSRAFWREGYEGWPLLGLTIAEPVGQITYHVREKFLPLFKDKIKKGGPEFDGHTSNDVIGRLINWAEALNI